MYSIVCRWSQYSCVPTKKKHQSEILSFFLFALLNILFIYLFNSNAFKIWIGCACLVIWYREIPHGPSMLLYNMCSMSLKNFNFGIEKVLAFIQFSLILTECNKPRWRFVIFHPNSISVISSLTKLYIFHFISKTRKTTNNLDFPWYFDNEILSVFWIIE